MTPDQERAATEEAVAFVLDISAKARAEALDAFEMALDRHGVRRQQRKEIMAWVLSNLSRLDLETARYIRTGEREA